MQVPVAFNITFVQCCKQIMPEKPKVRINAIRRDRTQATPEKKHASHTPFDIIAEITRGAAHATETQEEKITPTTQSGGAWARLCSLQSKSPWDTHCLEWSDHQLDAVVLPNSVHGAAWCCILACTPQIVQRLLQKYFTVLSSRVGTWNFHHAFTDRD
jgi:hypothetical protein